jgi:hypothetical protein
MGVVLSIAQTSDLQTNIQSDCNNRVPLHASPEESFDNKKPDFMEGKVLMYAVQMWYEELPVDNRCWGTSWEFLNENIIVDNALVVGSDTIYNYTDFLMSPIQVRDTSDNITGLIFLRHIYQGCVQFEQEF